MSGPQKPTDLQFPSHSDSDSRPKSLKSPKRPMSDNSLYSPQKRSMTSDGVPNNPLRVLDHNALAHLRSISVPTSPRAKSSLPRRPSRDKSLSPRRPSSFNIYVDDQQYVVSEKPDLFADDIPKENIPPNTRFKSTKKEPNGSLSSTTSRPRSALSELSISSRPGYVAYSNITAGPVTLPLSTSWNSARPSYVKVSYPDRSFKSPCYVTPPRTAHVIDTSALWPKIEVSKSLPFEIYEDPEEYAPSCDEAWTVLSDNKENAPSEALPKILET